MKEYVGHRGAERLAPENTAASFDAAITKKYDRIECDVQVTKDGFGVMFHDDTFERLTGTTKRVDECTLKEISDVSIQGHSILSLKEFITDYGQKIPLQIELKAQKSPELVATAIKKHNPTDVRISSFDLSLLKEIRALLPDASLCWLLSEIPEDVFTQLQEHNIQYIGPKASLCTVELIQESKSKGLNIYTYHSNMPEEIKFLHSQPIDSVGTNYFPEEIENILQQQ